MTILKNGHRMIKSKQFKPLSKSSRCCFRRSKRAAGGVIAVTAAVLNGLTRAIRNALRIRCDGIFARYKGSAYVSMCSRVRSFQNEFGWYRRNISCPMFMGQEFFYFSIQFITEVINMFIMSKRWRKKGLN